MENEKPIGGFLQLDSFSGKEFYNRGMSFNLGRTALVYAIKQKGYKKMWIPYYLCDCISYIFDREGIQYEYYHIDNNFLPLISECLHEYEAVLIVNYFGFLTENQLNNFQKKYGNVIIDNSQAFYAKGNQLSVYTCRKWFGVADGAYLSEELSKDIYENLPQDFSSRKVEHLARKYENPNENLYDIYSHIEVNNDKETIKKMSLLTKNLLKAVDYEKIAKIRTRNWELLDEMLGKYSEISIRSVSVPFMYGLYTDKADNIRYELKKYHIFLPQLWSNVLKLPDNWCEYKVAKNLLLLPLDQRYDDSDMVRLAEKVIMEINR